MRSGAVVETGGQRGPSGFCFYCGEEIVGPPTEDSLQHPTCMERFNARSVWWA